MNLLGIRLLMPKKKSILCLAELYLGSKLSLDDNNLYLDSYKLISAAHPKNIKQGGIFHYYIETLPVKSIQINYLPECLVCEARFEN